jgi:hypothetical protein
VKTIVFLGQGTHVFSSTLVDEVEAPEPTLNNNEIPRDNPPVTKGG